LHRGNERLASVLYNSADAKSAAPFPIGREEGISSNDITEISSFLSPSVAQEAAATIDNMTDTRPVKYASIGANAGPGLDHTAAKEERDGPGG
jgi:hypothetical protein